MTRLKNNHLPIFPEFINILLTYYLSITSAIIIAALCDFCQVKSEILNHFFIIAYR